MTVDISCVLSMIFLHFPFENYLQILKKLVKNAKNPISQVAKRLCEHESAEGPKNNVSNKRWQFVSENKRKGCFLLHNEDFAFVKEKRDGVLLCDVISQENLESFFYCAL